MKILMTRGLGNTYTEQIKDLGYELIYLSEKEMQAMGKEGVDKLEKIEDIYSADVLYTYMGLQYLDLKRMKKLKYIHLTSTGINGLPFKEIEEKGIYLSNNPFGYAVPMAETVVMYILELYKKAHKMFRAQKDRIWKQDFGWMELTGKKVGFLGTGNIAYETVKRLRAFGTVNWGVNTNGRRIEGFDRCFSVSDMDEFFTTCDVIVGIMPETSKTKGLVDERRFEMMKKGSIFINIGRGSLIDQKALERHIDKFKGVALDVFETEPLSKESGLWNYENLIITPHNSWVSEKNIERLGAAVVENLKHFIQYGEPKNYIKDFGRGY